MEVRMLAFCSCYILLEGCILLNDVFQTYGFQGRIWQIVSWLESRWHPVTYLCSPRTQRRGLPASCQYRSWRSRVFSLTPKPISQSCLSVQSQALNFHPVVAKRGVMKVIGMAAHYELVNLSPVLFWVFSWSTARVYKRDHLPFHAAADYGTITNLR